MNKFKLLCAAAVIAVPASAFVAPAAYAQQITASVSGRVASDSGAPIRGATVTVTDTRTGATRALTTGGDGFFNTDGLVTGGPYTITAEAEGYQGQTVEAVTLTVQGTTTFTFALEAAADEETIVVTAQRANVQLRAIGPGTAFNQTVLDNAPSFNRDIRDVIRIDPRVTLDREDAATGGSGADRISCLGGNDRGNSFTVDGILQSDIYGLNDTGFSSRSSTPIPYDAVRETQVQFAPFDVEYGQFTGCAINVVTKSGGNEFHGEAFFEYSSNALRGDRVADREVGPIEPDKRWGVSLGGPIFRDRLFFFGAYEHQEAGSSQDEGPTGAGFPNEVAGVSVEQFNQISEVLSRVYGIDTGGIVTSRPFTNDRWFGRIDWLITDDHRLELTYQRLEEATVRSDDFFTGSSPQVTGLNTFLRSGTQSDYYSARLYSQWTDNFSTEVRYSRSDVQDLQDPIGGGEAQSANPIPRIIVGIDNPPLGTSPNPAGQAPDATFLAGPGNSRSANDLQTTVDLFRFVGNLDAGNHRFKLGFEWNRADIFNLFVQNATGTLVFRNIADLEAGLLSPGTANFQTSTFPDNVILGRTEGAFGNFSRTGDVNDAAADFVRNIYSFYLQDEWRVTDRLDVVLGIRADLFSGSRPDVNPNFITRYGFSNTTGFSDIEPVIMPRFGFTYDAGDFAVFRSARLVGGVGIFSGGDPLVWFGNAFQNNGFGFATGTTQSADCGLAPGQQLDVVTNGQFTGVPQCIRQDGINQAAAGLGDTQSIDPDIKMPRVWRANIGFQTELGFGDSGLFSGWRLNLDYIYSRYQNPFTIVDLSQTPNISAGLNGFTIDGRPIYQAIDPTRANCNAELVDINPTPVWQNVTAACFGTSRDDELMLTNAGSYDSHIASVILSRNVEGGVFTTGGRSYFTIGYAYTDSSDRRNLFNSTAGSNYDLTAAFDRQNPDASRGFYSSRHNFTFSGAFTEEFLTDLRTRFGFTFVARSGRPYSLTFAGGGLFNDSASGNNNALVYLPTGPNDPNISPTSNAAAVGALVDFANSLDCARPFIGRSIPRNTCTNDWYYDLDLNFSQELPGPGRLISGGRFRDTMRLYVMFDNFLNFLDRDWNVQRRRNFAGLQEIAGISGVDAQGRYIISNANPILVDTNPNSPNFGTSQFQRDNFINVSSSVWRIKVGISYEF